MVRQAMLASLARASPNPADDATAATLGTEATPEAVMLSHSAVSVETHAPSTHGRFNDVSGGQMPRVSGVEEDAEEQMMLAQAIQLSLQD